MICRWPSSVARHVEDRDQVEALIAQILQRGDTERRLRREPPRELDRRPAEVDAERAPVAAQVVREHAGAAADVEHPQPGARGQ
jgi:hypothetical protein